MGKEGKGRGTGGGGGVGGWEMKRYSAQGRVQEPRGGPLAGAGPEASRDGRSRVSAESANNRQERR